LQNDGCQNILLQMMKLGALGKTQLQDLGGMKARAKDGSVVFVLSD